LKTLFKIIIIVLALGLLGGVMAYLAGYFEPKIPLDFTDVLPSATDGREFTVEITLEPIIEQAPVTARAKVETVISPIITATISSIAVRAGDEVKRGEVLAELDSRELNARVDQAHQAFIAARATLSRVEKDLKRIERIRKADPGAIAKAELDRAQAAMETARAELLRAQRQEDEVKTALSYSQLVAPISGCVVERYADPGDTAQQGQPLLRIYDHHTLRLEANVRESVASKLMKGRRLEAKIDALNTYFPVVVDEIVPSADPGSRSFLVKVSLQDGMGLYPGMFGRLLIPLGRTEAIYIPLEAVTHVGQLDFVTVKTEQGPVRRYVRLGTRRRENQVEVISGLVPGEKLLIPAR
jgi:RND family efflux transporter MFP subunit